MLIGISRRWKELACAVNELAVYAWVSYSSKVLEQLVVYPVVVKGVESRKRRIFIDPLSCDGVDDVLVVCLDDSVNLNGLWICTQI